MSREVVNPILSISLYGDIINFILTIFTNIVVTLVVALRYLVNYIVYYTYRDKLLEAIK